MTLCVASARPPQCVLRISAELGLRFRMLLDGNADVELGFRSGALTCPHDSLAGTLFAATMLTISFFQVCAGS